MALPKVFNWLAPSTNAVSLNQTTAGAGVLILNGSLVPDSSIPTAIFPGMSRTVSITSTGNLSGVNFTVYGTLNSAIVTQTIAGPNNTTVQTTQLFDTVTAVAVSGAVGTNVSVGIGTTGYTHWYRYNYHATVYGFGVQVVVSNTINYTFQSTMDDPNIIAVPTAFPTIHAMSSATTNQIGGHATLSLPNGAGNYDAFVPIPINYCNILINSSTNGSLIATFIQQGIT